jgi:hypothetical protein
MHRLSGAWKACNSEPIGFLYTCKVMYTEFSEKVTLYYINTPTGLTKSNSNFKRYPTQILSLSPTMEGAL